MARRFQKQQEPEDNNQQFNYGSPKVPEGKYVAGYIRQSTKGQADKYHESAEMQEEDVVNVAKRLGVSDEAYIIIFTENAGKDGKSRNASGRLRIDQREHLQALVERIESGEVKAVIVWKEDRLFRDETLIQPLTFADICKRNNCLIATPHYTYDFNRNRFDLQLFIQKAVEAANFLKDYVKQQLTDGKIRVAMRGEYDGRAVPFGYLFERKPLDPRVRAVRKPVVYEPNAEIVNALFKRLYELGNIADFHREMRQLPYIFPEYPDDIKAKYITKTNASEVLGGYHLGRAALIQLLTNPMYIGHWAVHNVIVRYNNHPPIVEKYLFDFAYNLLADTTLDGEPNEARYRRPPVRYHQYGKAPHTALLMRRLTTIGGAIHVFARDRGDDYTAWTKEDCNNRKDRMFSFPAAPLDEIFVQRLFALVEDFHYAMQIERILLQLQEKRTQALVSVDSQMAVCKKQIAADEATLKLPPDVLDDYTRGETARSLKKARQVLAELESRCSEEDEINEQDIKEYASILEHIRDVFDTLTLEKKRKLISLMTYSVSIQKITQRWFRFSVTWRVPISGPHPYSAEEDVAFIWRGNSPYVLYSKEEEHILREHYPNTPADEILRMLPKRNWQGISAYAAGVLKIKRENRVHSAFPSIPHNISMEDLEIYQELGVSEELGEHMKAFWISSPVNFDVSSL